MCGVERGMWFINILLVSRTEQKGTECGEPDYTRCTVHTYISKTLFPHRPTHNPQPDPPFPPARLPPPAHPIHRIG